MCRVDPYVRLTADNNGETRCIIFVDELKKAEEGLKKHTSKIVMAYPFISAFGAHISVHSLEELSKLSFVKAISSHTTVTANMDRARDLAGISGVAYENNFGENVTVAVIDTGLKPHLDFLVPRERTLFIDFINGENNLYDDNGHGTAVSSILCGSGLVSNRRFRGIAPKANLIALKAIGKNGEGGAFKILEAMQWIHTNRLKYNIRVACMSFGSEPIENAVDPLSLGATALVKSGVSVIASAGNDGPKKGTIKSPGISLDVVTVGGAELTDGKIISVPDFSSRGPVGRFIKPDVIAPAVDITCCGLTNFYTVMTGTSMAAPIVAGLAALMYSANPSLSPLRVKELIINAALPLPLDPTASGAGLINAKRISELLS